MVRRPSASTVEPATPAELIDIGGSIQRFWLTAAKLGLAMQPILATIAFSHYGEGRITFSSELGLLSRAESLARSFRQTLGVASGEVVFVGRIGEPSPRLPTHRSVRRPLADLMV